MLPMVMLVASCHWQMAMCMVHPSQGESSQSQAVGVCTLHWRFVRCGQLVTRSSSLQSFLCRQKQEWFLYSSPTLTYGRPVLLSGGIGFVVRGRTRAFQACLPCRLPCCAWGGWVLCQRYHFRLLRFSVTAAAVAHPN